MPIFHWLFELKNGVFVISSVPSFSSGEQVASSRYKPEPSVCDRCAIVALVISTIAVGILAMGYSLLESKRV